MQWTRVRLWPLAASKSKSRVALTYMCCNCQNLTARCSTHSPLYVLHRDQYISCCCVAFEWPQCGTVFFFEKARFQTRRQCELSFGSSSHVPSGAIVCGKLKRGLCGVNLYVELL